MSYGILVNAFVNILGGLVGLVMHLNLRKMKRRKESSDPRKKSFVYLSYFLGLYGLLWFTGGVRMIFLYFGEMTIEKFLWDFVSGPLVYIQFLPICYFFGSTLFADKKALKSEFQTIFTVFAIVTLATHFIYGSIPGEMTEFGTRPVDHPITNNLFFFTLFLPALICTTIEFFRRFLKWRKTQDQIEGTLFGINLGLLVYGVAGILDVLTMAKGWVFLTVRIGIMLSSLIIYLVVAGGIKEDL